jgi:hypothetical protein
MSNIDDPILAIHMPYCRRTNLIVTFNQIFRSLSSTPMKRLPNGEVKNSFTEIKRLLMKKFA